MIGRCERSGRIWNPATIPMRNRKHRGKSGGFECRLKAAGLFVLPKPLPEDTEAA